MASAATAIQFLAALFSITSAYHLLPKPNNSQIARQCRSRRLSQSNGYHPRRRPFSATSIVMMGDKATDIGMNDMDATPFKKVTNQHKPSPLSGMPVGPSSSSTPPNSVIIRYMYDGGQIGQGRLCHLHPADSTIHVSQVIEALCREGVDFDTFYACAYESQESTGGWMNLEPAPRYRNPWNEDNQCAKDSTLKFTIPPPDDTSASRRIDIKLFRRPKVPSHTESIQSLDDALHTTESCVQNEQSIVPIVEHSSDALHSISASIPGGKISCDKGYFGIGILAPKTKENVGTLWRSAYQLGASVLYTIGGRYKSSSTDTLNVPARIPLIELNDWSSFVEWAAPKTAVWVAIEMGGTPLSEFDHPRNAIYILGSEDHGVPKSVVRGCREVVSLESDLYGSYNVAVAGSIVMYDRLMKMRKKEKGEKNS